MCVHTLFARVCVWVCMCVHTRFARVCGGMHVCTHSLRSCVCVWVCMCVHTLFARVLPSCVCSMAENLRALKEYVTGGDCDRYSSIPEGFVRIDVTHSNLAQRWHDILVYLECTIMDLKLKLFKKNGTLIDSMELYIRHTSRPTVYMGDDTKTFKYYGGCNGCEIHIRDTDPFSISANGALENINLVEKYVMPDSVYDALPNTLRSHIKTQRAKDPNFKIKLATNVPQPKSAYPPTPKNAYNVYALKSRCEVNPGGRRGQIEYVGEMAGLAGTWIGVELDEPLGNNAGTGPDGIEYFKAKPNYGCFARHYNVIVGDFPEIDPLASSDDEI